MGKHKWVDIVFLSDEDGRELVDRLTRTEGSVVHGPTAETIAETVIHLSGWDFGDESEHSPDEDEPWNAADPTAEHGGYVLNWNVGLGYVGLSRPLLDEDDVKAAEDDLLESAIWTGTRELSENGDDTEPLEPDVEIPEDVRAELVADWQDFARGNALDILRFMEATERGMGHVAHDFHLTRNGHGTGFWDRGAGEVGDRLTEACKAYGAAELSAHGQSEVFVNN